MSTSSCTIHSIFSSSYINCVIVMLNPTIFFAFFFFNDTATTEIYTLSLHDALPISDHIILLEQVLGVFALPTSWLYSLAWDRTSTLPSRNKITFHFVHQKSQEP